MPHVQEAMKEEINDGGKGLADAISDLQNKVHPDPPAPQPEPTIIEKITEPVKNLFRSSDSTEKEGSDHHCTKKEGECPQTDNIRDELKK